MPTTPWCQCPVGQDDGPGLGAPVQTRTHCWKISPSMALPLPVELAQLLGQLLGPLGGSVSSSSTGQGRLPIRPEALIRGARV